MGNDFVNKLNNKEYISKKLYDYVFLNEKHLISSGFNLDKYNDEILERDYLKYQNYFESMYKGIDDEIILDKDQCKAILADEDYALIIAGAGTGKTTTMTSKVKYLVDIKDVDPEKILVMSYTRKAVEELSTRIVDKFQIPAHVKTFHSLGYEYIKTIFANRKCSIIGYNDKKQLFLKYIKEKFQNKEEFSEMIEVFQPLSKRKNMFSSFIVDNYMKYDTYDEYFKAFRKYRIEEAGKRGIENIINNFKNSQMVSEDIKTLNGEYVKSVPEMIIANFLFEKGVDYYYEEIYSEVFDGNRVYRPDFTLTLAGQKVYLEYYGLDNENYNRIKEIKREHHKSKRNLYIELDRVKYEDIEKELDLKLKEMGFVYRGKTPEEIYDKMLENNPVSQVYIFEKFMFEMVSKIKESSQRDNYKEIIELAISKMNESEQEIALKQFKYLNDFYHFYETYLFGRPDVYFFDFADLLYYSHVYIHNVAKNKLNYDYVIIDEYQDISKSRYELAKKTADRSDARVFAVGDDWQSIYAFSGSRIEYLYDFEKFFSSSKLFKIKRTYRNSQQLIDHSGAFIMKNKSQIEKELVSDKRHPDPVKFVVYNQEQYASVSARRLEYEVLKDVILKIHEKNPEHKILILGRTNNIVDRLFEDDDFKDDIDTKVTFRGHENIHIEAMTMHKSKGLTYDEVIVIGLNQNFPISGYGMYWLEELFDNSLYDEEIEFAEERRLFYVALTRTKNHVFLLTNSKKQDRSPFLDELYHIMNKKKDV